MALVKKMAFSGSWYPADADECHRSISGFLKEKKGRAGGQFSGGIVPHAGWFFSGSIACRVIASLQSTDPVDLVIVFGGHMRPQDKPMILASGSVQTPFGDLPVAEDLMGQINWGKDVLSLTPDQFPDENTLELQYPFVRFFFPEAKIVACCVPPSERAVSIGRAIMASARRLSMNTKVIGSTDMTHYGPNFGMTSAGTGEKAVEWVKNTNDRQAIEAMLELNEQKIIEQGLNNRNMCCSGAAAAAVAACKENGAVTAQTLDYATSFERSAGSSFVGYAGVLFS